MINVVLQWCGLLSNIVMMAAITSLLGSMFKRTAEAGEPAVTAAVAAGARFICTIWAGRMSYLSSKEVKKTLREAIYRKLLQLGNAYRSFSMLCWHR